MTNDANKCRDAERYGRLIDAIVLDEMPSAEWPALREHLRGCDGCRERYNRASLAARMLHGGPAAAFTPSPSELERIATAVMPDEPKLGWFGRLATALRPAQKLGLVFAGVAAVAAVVVFPLLKKNGAASDDELQPRGGTTKPTQFFATDGHSPPKERAAGVRAFCLEGDKVTAVTNGTHCAAAAQLKLAVTNGGRFANLFLVGVDGQRDVKWYAPRPPETQSIAAPQDPGEVPVGVAVRLGVNHGAGPVRVYALFSDTPVAAADVEKAVEGLPTPLPETLPLRRSDVLQRSLSFEVAP